MYSDAYSEVCFRWCCHTLMVLISIYLYVLVILVINKYLKMYYFKEQK